jgi:hypothetical protein
MIRPLRKRHRAMVVVLALVVPPLFALGILGRPQEARMAAMPEGLAPEAVDPGAVISRHTKGAMPEFTARATLFARGDGVAVTVETTPHPVRPELLVYWSADAVSGASLPETAYLLGSLGSGGPTAFDLPVEAAGRDGHLVLYALAQSEVVETILLRAGRPSAEE